MPDRVTVKKPDHNMVNDTPGLDFSGTCEGNDFFIKNVFYYGNKKLFSSR
jgi:hypothetical protein